MFSSADKLAAPPITDPTVEAARLLFVHVICQAVDDHAAPGWRNEVDAFFSGPTFASYCALLGWNHDWARRRIQHFVRAAGSSSRAQNQWTQYEV